MSTSQHTNRHTDQHPAEPTGESTGEPTRERAPERTGVAGQARRPLARRTVLATGAAAGAGLAVAGTAAPAQAGRRRRRVFAHGVASGDPKSRAVVIWTRVTPTRDATPGSGKGPLVTVRWEVARDRRFTRVVRSGSFTTSASRDHTVKVDVRRLRPGTRYYYRFRWDGVTSPVGRTKTAPRALATPRRLRFGVVSCANLQAGWFSAYRHLAKRRDLDAIIHLGDYLYEYAPGEYGYGQSNVDVRPHDPPREMVTLEDYRRRHAQYKRDRDLQALHRRNAFIVTWDDHEVTNDQWRRGAENHDAGEGDYLQRRARAHRAYDEWMPVRLDGTAALRDGTRLFRRLRFGRLAELSMLDLRTYRDRQVDTAAPSPVPTPAEQVDDPERTVTGRRQLDWLKAALRNNRGVQWKLVGNPVMIAPVTFADLPHEAVDPVNDVTGLLPRDGFPYNVDQWDGYTDDRREIFEHVLDNGVKDVVFLTGDIHSGWACDLPLDHATYPLGDTAGVEFVCTSVTSNNLKDITGDPSGATSTAVEETIKANNRHVRYLDFDSHGFSVLDVTPARAQMDWYVVGDRQDRDAGVRHAVSWATDSGTNRVHQVDNPAGA